MRGSYKVVKFNISKWYKNYRIYLLVCLIGIVMFNRSHVFVGITEKYKYAVNFFAILPSVMGGYLGFSRFISMFCVVLLFCDAPFMDDNQQFVFTRVGKRRWVQGSEMYIIIASFLYVLWLVVSTFLGALPNVGLSLQWGKIMENVCVTGEIKTLGFTQNILLDWKVLLAFLYSFFSLWMTSVIIGLIMFLVNLFFSRVAGVIVGGLVVIFDGAILFLPNNLGKILFRFSPFSMIRLNDLNITGQNKLYPGVIYAIVFYILIILILMVIIMANYKKVNIDIQERV